MNNGPNQPLIGRVREWTGIALAFGLTIVWGLSAPLGRQQVPMQLLREAGWWAIGAVVLSWAIRREHLTFADLHVARPRWSSLGWGVVFGIILMMLFGVCYAVIFPALGVKSNPAQLAEIANRPIWMVLLLTLRAGVVEEWLFRFYAITRIEILSANRWLASLVPAVLFIAMHAPSWGPAHLIPVTLATVIATLLYWWRRDFWCSALAHFIADFVPFAGMAMAITMRQ